MEVWMISSCLYLKVCGMELMVRVAKLILHCCIKITSLGNNHINTNCAKEGLSFLWMVLFLPPFYWCHKPLVLLIKMFHFSELRLFLSGVAAQFFLLCLSLLTGCVLPFQNNFGYKEHVTCPVNIEKTLTPFSIRRPLCLLKCGRSQVVTGYLPLAPPLWGMWPKLVFMIVDSVVASILNVLHSSSTFPEPLSPQISSSWC